MSRLSDLYIFKAIMNEIPDLDHPAIDDPNDAGGYTKFGLSQRANPEINVRLITLEGAISHYKLKYWNAEYDNFKDKKLVWMLYDSSLPQGPYTVTRILQKALNDKYDTKLKVDGILGRRTRLAVNSIKNKETLRGLFAEGMLKEIDKDSQKGNNYLYKDGWRNRLFRSLK